MLFSSVPALLFPVFKTRESPCEQVRAGYLQVSLLGKVTLGLP